MKLIIAVCFLMLASCSKSDILPDKRQKELVPVVETHIFTKKNALVTYSSPTKSFQMNRTGMSLIIVLDTITEQGYVNIRLESRDYDNEMVAKVMMNNTILYHDSSYNHLLSKSIFINKLMIEQ